MFQQARIKLTAWYLCIIMLVSISFSMVIYRAITMELDRVQYAERLRIERRFPTPMTFEPELFTESKKRLGMNLIVINGLIFIGSAAAGYFLAGRTLRPIADMMDKQNQFITDASHELRTPLTAMKAELEVNIRNTHLSLVDAKRILVSNLEEVNNLQTLSDNLIRLTNNQPKNDETFSLQSSIKTAIKRVKGSANKRRITFFQNATDYLIHGNKALIVELWVLLLDNAIKYSHQNSTIRIAINCTEETIDITIQDQGIGIAKEDLPHVFDRFWRADKSRTKETKGYGLGLSIAKQIVDYHRGKLSVQSTLAKGSAFTVHLPI